ncbi:MAG TPA: type IV secretion system DNA-binding domain-containing protein [Vicinamibacterales bacterium]|nr:type IV secretion system DNA-binding domain-containing protein [Vicinamibacterales bacterium]
MSPPDVKPPAAALGSNAKVTVEGSVWLGHSLELRQQTAPTARTAFQFSAALPGSGPLLAVDQIDVETSPSAMPATQLGWDLASTEQKLAIVDKGLTESYMIFGASGSGKTHFLMYLLRQMLALNGGDPQRKMGGLILDPKAALIDDVRRMLRIAGRLDDLVVINADDLAGQPAVNILDCSLDPVELGKVLILAAQCAGAAASDPFWFGAWANLFKGAVPLLQWRDEVRLSMASLMDAVLSVEERDDGGSPLRRIQRIAREARAALKTLSADRRADMQIAIEAVEGFYRQEPKNVETVEMLMRDAFGDFRGSKWRCYSGLAPNAPGGAASAFYDRIIDEGKIVLLSVSNEEMVMAKVICTIVKVLFQRAVLSRLQRVRRGELKNFERMVMLVADEYALVATELPGNPMGDGQFLSLCRQFGCMAILAAQSVNVLQSSSLKEHWKAVVSQCAAKVYMRLNDNETAEEATKLAGEYDWYLTGRGTSQQKDGAGSSTNLEMRERKALPAAILTQVLQLGQGAMVGSLDGKRTRDTVRFFQAPPTWD